MSEWLTIRELRDENGVCSRGSYQGNSCAAGDRPAFVDGVGHRILLPMTNNVSPAVLLSSHHRDPSVAPTA
jgi:hypothetical protein